MAGAPEYKYTDQDVREDDRLRTIALNYLAQYGGDYAPLVERKLELGRPHLISTRDIRVILNCMRHDFNVAATLPRPERVVVSEIAPRQRKTKAQREADWEKPCGYKTEPHTGHGWTDTELERHWCKGIDWPIMRGQFFLDAIIKAPYAVAQARSMVHKPVALGNVKWYPNFHEWGWLADPELEARMVCKTYLRRPILLKELPDNSSPLTAIPLCKRCFSDVNQS